MFTMITRLLRLTEDLYTRIKHMDAQVQALTQNVATLQTQVSAVLTGAKVIDPADEAALVAVNATLVSVNNELTAFLSPPTATGGTGPAASPATPAA